MRVAAERGRPRRAAKGVAPLALSVSWFIFRGGLRYSTAPICLPTVPLNNVIELRQLMNSPQTQHSENDAVNCPGAVKLLRSPALLMEITDRTPVRV